MKKLMFAAVAALGMTTAFAIESDVVGYSTDKVTIGTRSMRTTPFLGLSGTAGTYNINDIPQTVGDPGEFILCVYQNNAVSCRNRYMYFTADVLANIPKSADKTAGWRVLDKDDNPIFASGAQSVEIGYGQACVIESKSTSAEYTAQGTIEAGAKSFQVPLGARRMMGNILPRTIKIGEITQVSGDPGEIILCTYKTDAVSCVNRYMYFTADILANIPESADKTAGWRVLDKDDNPIFASGAQDVDLLQGQGFVIESKSNTVEFLFPAAM